MRVTADTNVLIRAMTGDDEHQSRVAREALATAEKVVLTLPALCELAWVLSQSYKIAAADIARGMRRLTDGADIVVNRAAVDAGFAMLDAGGDFADGIIAYEGSCLGAELLISFDKKAVKLLQARGHPAQLLITS